LPGVFDRVLFEWVRREENEAADALSRKAYRAYVRKHGLQDVTMPFGRFKGRPLGWVAARHPRYLQWLARQEWVRGDLKGAVRMAARAHR
jgi:uncharacterized protein (DUF3820 family)